MITVYEANSSIDAKLIEDQLSLNGIESQIVGELLQGGIGELQPQGLVKVLCDEIDFDRAREIIIKWESKKIQTSQNNHLLKKMKTGSFTKFLLFLYVPIMIAGIYVLILLIRYYFFR